MARYHRRGRHQQHVAAELEIMPMLNVFIAIIPLLLLSAAFVQVTVIQATLPSAPLASEAAAAETDAALDLTVVIRPDVYLVRVKGAAVVAIARSNAPKAKGETNPARERLSQVLGEIVAAHPGHRDVLIIAEPNTRYEEIVEVMDTTRAAGLPEATLADASLGIS